MFFTKKKLKISLKPTKTFFSMFMVAIAVVMVWRGVWNFLDHYLFPDNFILSNVLSIAIGLLILYLPDQNLKELV